MHVISARNPQNAIPKAAALIKRFGVAEETRNGPALRLMEPVTTRYLRPQERVIFWPQRDANPFFHLYESLWMLGGRWDLGSIAQYAAQMAEYSDDGETLHGAYGKRWRNWFDIDQIATIILALKNNPTCRRQVLQMWDVTTDLAREGKDVPCNLMVHFQQGFQGCLDMTVFNRSNDIVWGAYGANCVHMSMLHEYVACGAKMSMGRYWQVSDNWHAYEATLSKFDGVEDNCWWDPYASGEVSTFPLINTDTQTWNNDLEMFLDEGPGTMGFQDIFFRRVASPMSQAYFKHKSGDTEAALALVDKVVADDWRRAAREWLTRRLK